MLNLTGQFKTAIKNQFYDKTFIVFEDEVVVDDEGWARISTDEQTTTFKGNANFSRLQKIQQDYGITEQIDIAITTDYSIENGKIIGYLGKQFKLVQVVPFDSHYLLIGTKWSSTSST